MNTPSLVTFSCWKFPKFALDAIGMPWEIVTQQLKIVFKLSRVTSGAILPQLLRIFQNLRRTPLVFIIWEKYFFPWLLKVLSSTTLGAIFPQLLKFPETYTLRYIDTVIKRLLQFTENHIGCHCPLVIGSRYKFTANAFGVNFSDTHLTNISLNSKYR